MHSFRQTAAILKLPEKQKDPSRSLNGVRTEIPALTFYAVSQITVENSINPRHVKQKACQNKLSSFFTVEKRQKVMKIQWKKFSHLKRYQIFCYRLIANTENQKKTLIMRKQQPFRGLRKKQIEKNYSYLLTKWRTKIKFLSLHGILFWLQLASYKHC